MYGIKLFKILLSKGIIPCTLNTHKNIYEAYLLEKNKGLKTSQAVSNIAENFNTSEKTVYGIIKKMK